MQIIQAILLGILTIAVICGVVLIPIPFYRLIRHQKRIHRPYFTIEELNDCHYILKNTGNSEAIIEDLFLTPETKYFEGVNGISFAPQQTITIELPEKEADPKLIELHYRDTNLKKLFRQKLPLMKLTQSKEMSYDEQ